MIFALLAPWGVALFGVGLGLASVWPRIRYVSAFHLSGVVCRRFGQVYLAFAVVIVEFCHLVIFVRTITGQV